MTSNEVGGAHKGTRGQRENSLIEACCVPLKPRGEVRHLGDVPTPRRLRDFAIRSALRSIGDHSWSL